MKLRLTGGTAAGRVLRAPEGLGTRPALARVRDSLFNILAPNLEGATLLDCFAGTGSLAFEGLSRNAAHAVCVDLSPACIEVIRENAAMLGWTDRVTAISASAFAIPRLSEIRVEQFDIVFVDPPYPIYDSEEENLQQMLRELAATSWIHPETLFIAEYRTRDDWTPDPGRFSVYRRKKYGQTSLAFFTPIG